MHRAAPSGCFRTWTPAWGASRGYHSAQGVFGYRAGWSDEQQHLARQGIHIQRQARNEQANLHRYVQAFRRLGHAYAKVNPVPVKQVGLLDQVEELQASSYGLSKGATFPTDGILFANATKECSLEHISSYLQQLYCGSVAADFTAVQDEKEHEWLLTRYEQMLCDPNALSTDDRCQLAKEMLRCQNFDHFLASKFSTVKRYGGEGAEAMVSFFLELFNSAGHKFHFRDIVLGMPHRGRLNILTGLLHFPPVVLFRKMMGLPEFPAEQKGGGDVLSHFGASVDLQDPAGHPIHVMLLNNPSHLEAVNAVACGKARGRHLSRNSGHYRTSGAETTNDDDDVLCVTIHGDAAFTGQGINQEILEMSLLPHYSVGGTLHLIVNNQVGFTTPGDRGRSHQHSAQLGHFIGSPILHVNGDHPEALMKMTRLAMEYRKRFQKDIFVELHCFRRWGHNELDDPTFTNPKLYSQIQGRQSVPDAYCDGLISAGLWTLEQKNQVLSEHSSWLAEHHKKVETYQPERQTLRAQWSGLSQPSNCITVWDTGLPADLLKYIGAQSVSYPDDFAIHPHLKKHHVDGRIKKLVAGTGIDWGTAEALAIGSLLFQGFNVRISGQDVGRATFSHRHAMLVDQTDNEMFIPLNQMTGAEGHECGHLEMANSPLSEEAVLGFEYGLSIDHPKNFVIWEAQFGDFFNGAQIMLDTYVSSGESKWGLQSALTLLLPHGLDGAGPEHSSCRIERFLQMSDSKESAVDGDDVNWHIVNPTTPAQYFHLLRRQMIRNFRKPLVVVAPKILLRLPAATSSLEDMRPGTHFLPVLGDSRPDLDPKAIRRVVFVSGKHYYSLAKRVQELNMKHVALIRVEQLCPFPTQELQDELSRFPNASEFVWSQEEHRNSGAWSFASTRMANLVGVRVRYAGRAECCLPAVGVASIHRQETEQILADALD